MGHTIIVSSISLESVFFAVINYLPITIMEEVVLWTTKKARVA